MLLKQEGDWAAYSYLWNDAQNEAELVHAIWHPWLLNLVTPLSVLWEIFFCVLIWRPSLRPLMLAGAVVLHLGIGACLGMWTFGLIMLVGCASFLPNQAVRDLVAALSPERSRLRTALIPFPTPQPAASWPSRPEVPEPALPLNEA